MADATTFLDIGYRYNKQGEDEWVRGGKRVRQAGRGVEDQTDKLNKRLRSSEGAFRSSGKGAASLTGGLGLLKGAMVALPVLALVGVLTSATKAWGQQQEAAAQVEARLRSTGNVIGLTSGQIQAYASELQALTGVGDELLLQQASVLLSFKGISREAFPGALKAALNLSAGLKTDLSSSILQLGKALDDPIKGLTALQRSGTIFTQSQKDVIKALVETGDKAKAQQIILAELESQYGGAAEAARNTATGGMRALRGELGDLLEQIGRLISEGTTPLVEDLITLTRTVTGAVSRIEELDRAFISAQHSGNRFLTSDALSTWLVGNTLRTLELQDATTQLELAQVRSRLAAIRGTTAFQERAAAVRAAEEAEEALLAGIAAVIPPLTAEEKAHKAAADAAKGHADGIHEVTEAYREWRAELEFLRSTEDIIPAPLEGGAAAPGNAAAFLSQFGAAPGQLPMIPIDPESVDTAAAEFGILAADYFEPGLLSAGQTFALQASDAFSSALQRGIASGDLRSAFQGLAGDLGGLIGGAVSQSAGNALGGGLGGLIGGGLLGGVAAGLVENIIGGLFQRGGDQAFAELAALDGQLQVVAGTIEGDLRPALTSMAEGIIQTTNQILAEFGGQLDAAVMGFLIRRGGDDGNIARVFWKGLEREFENDAAAAGFLVAKLISEGVVSGLGASVAEAVAGGTFESVEELLSAMRLGEAIDASLRSPLEQFFEDQARNARMLLTEAAPLGISLERVVQAQAAMTQATLDQHAAVVKSALGISSALDQWDELDHSIAILMPESLRQMEAELMAAAEQAQNLADTTGAAEAAFDRGIDSYREWLGEMQLTDRQIERLTTLHEEWTAAGLDQEEIMRRTSAELRDFAVELEGLPIDQMQRAARVMRLDFMGGLLSQMADVLRQTGNVEEANRLEAQSKELVLRMQILQIRATVQEAFARERLTAEQVQGYNEFIRMMQRGLNELIRTGGFATGGGSGGGGIGGGDITSGIDEQAQALEFWNRIMQDATDTVLGITAAERARMDTEAELRRLNELNLISDERLAEALAAMEAAASHVEKPILDATQALRDNADAWQGFLGVVGGLADLKPDLFTLEDDLGSLSGALNSLGVELPVDQARALAGWEFELRRLRVLEILATKGAAAALGEHFLPIMQSVSDMTFGFDPPGSGSGSGRRTGASLGLGRAPGTGRGGGRNALEGLLDRLADWERDLEISLMDPLDAALARAADRGEAFIAQLVDAGATQAAIMRAQMAMAQELEQISARAWEAALDPLRSLYDDLTTGPLSGANNAVQLEAARARFDDLQARAAGGDVQAARELEAAARDLLAAAQASNSALLITRIQGVVAAGLGGVLGIGDPGDDGGKPGDRPVILKPRDVVEPVHLTATDLMVVAAGGDLGTASALPRLADAFRGAVTPSGHIRLDTNGMETELRRQRDSATAEAAELRRLVSDLLEAQRDRNRDANDADDVKIDLSAGQLRALSEVAEQPQPTVGTKA